MPRLCTVCAHPDKAAINTALAGGASARETSAKFRETSEDALTRHRAAHIPAAMVKAQEAEDVRQAIDVVKQLKAINGASLAILSEARQMRDGELALKAIDRIHRQVELRAKLLGQLDDRPQVNLSVSLEWVNARTTLMAALWPYPEARVAVAASLDALEGPNGHAG